MAAYVAGADGAAALAAEAARADAALAGVEGELGAYAAELGGAAAEIRALQARSGEMRGRLAAHRGLQAGLAAFIERVALPPALVAAVLDAPPGSDAWLAALAALSAKLDAFAADAAGGAPRPAAAAEVAPELERLRAAAARAARSLLLERIYSLRRPRTNVQIKQGALARLAPAAAFLRAHAPVLHAEARAAYVDAVAAKVSDVLRGYWAALERLEAPGIGAEDLLGAPDGGGGGAAAAAAAGAGGVFAMLQRAAGVGGGAADAAIAPAHARPEAFSIGDRAAALAALDAPPVVPHEAAARGARLFLEARVRSAAKLLADAAASEYEFCAAFWAPEGGAVCAAVLAPGVAFVEDALEAALAECADPLALLLAARLNRARAVAMARRASPALDAHFDRVNLLIWPRLKAALDAQLASLRAPAPEAPDAPPRLHPVAARYAALASGLFLLHAGLGDAPLERDLERLRYGAMSALLALSRGLHPARRGAAFLALNFSHVAAALRDAAARPPPGVGGGDGADGGSASSGALAAAAAAPSPLGAAGDAALAAFEESLGRAISLYVDDRLQAGVPELVAFVRRGEAAAARAPPGAPLPGFGAPEAGPLAADFAARWERAAEVLGREVAADLGRGEAAAAVRRAAFTALLLAWSRFLDLLKGRGAEAEAVAARAVPVAAVLYRLKQIGCGG